MFYLDVADTTALSLAHSSDSFDQELMVINNN